MPFQDSIISGTKPHVHSALSTQGGFLETGATGMTNLSEGSIIYGNASEIQTELTVGSNSQVLTLAGGVPTWASGSGGLSGSPVRSYATSSTPQATSSSSMIDCTSFAKTLSAGNGYAIVTFNGFVESNENFYFRWSFSVDGNQPEIKFKGSGTFRSLISLQAVTSSLGAQDIQLQMRVHDPAGTMTLQADSSNGNMYVLEFPT
jgi:hypothetical protein